jgi:phosphoribosylformylglycinamidine cyclo-ligase
VPRIFRLIQKGGPIEEDEMLRTFNNGIGMILTVPPREKDGVLQRLKGLREKAYLIGEIVRAAKGEGTVQFQ